MGYKDYEDAMKCANEARQRLDPTQDPVLFNLTGSLFAIAQGLQRDLPRLEQQLRQLEQALRSRQI